MHTARFPLPRYQASRQMVLHPIAFSFRVFSIEINPFLAHLVSYFLFYRNIEKLSLFNFIITDFDLLPSSGIYSTFLLIDPSSGKVFSNHLEIHALQIGKQGEKSVTDMDDLEKWLLFFKGHQKAKEEVQSIIESRNILI